MASHHERPVASSESQTMRLARLQEQCDPAHGELLRALDAFPVPVAIWQAADGQILYANAALEATLAMPPSSLWGRDLSAFIPKLADRRRLARRAAQNGCAQGVEVEGRREDDSPLWWSVWQQRMVCTGAECLLTLLVNITDRKQEEANWQAGRRTLELLLRKFDRDQEALACEIHDGLIQEITGALMFLEATCQGVEHGQPANVEQLQTVVGLLRSGIKEARRLMEGFRGPDVARGGLVAALQTLIDKVSTNSGIAIGFEHNGHLAPLSLASEQAVYRMIQESLSNVRRHSQTQRARVALTQHEGYLEIVVQDWGIGFDPTRVGDKTFGLSSLRQRAQLLGGHLHIESRRGTGTTLRIALPSSGGEGNC